MAHYKSDIVDINLNTGNIHRSFLSHSIGQKDDDADRLGIRAFRDGVPQDLSGASCHAWFLNSQGTTIALTSYGTVSGNEAYVTLPPACYDYDGPFTLAIKIVGGGVSSTVRIVDGMVDNINTGGAVTPTSAVPTYSEIIAQYDAMVAATSAANTAIAETFDATKNYPEWKNVINDGALYILPDGHEADTTWANTTKKASKLGDQASALIQKPPIHLSTTRNLFNSLKAYLSSQKADYDGVEFVGYVDEISGIVLLSAKDLEQGTTYTISFDLFVEEGSNSKNGLGMYLYNTSGEIESYKTAGISSEGYTRKSFKFETSENSKYIIFGRVNTTDNIYHVRNIQVEAGETSTPYVQYYSAINERELQNVSGADMTSAIEATLNQCGECRLGKGEYIVNGLNMPEGSVLRGCGDATKIRFPDDGDGACVIMGNRCSIADVSFIGADEDITLGDDFIGHTSDTEDPTKDNLWEDGDQSISNAGFKHLVLTNPLPAGTYKIFADVSSDVSSSDTSGIFFSKSHTTSIAASDIITSVQFPREEGAFGTFYLPKAAYSVRLTCGSSASSVGNASFSNIKIEQYGSRCGVMWMDEAVQYGSIHNCRFSRFSTAGILLQDTGTPVTHYLLISDCSFYNNNVGVYVRKDSEFNKITNCGFTLNYYGAIVRGGNNYLTNCGLDANVVGISVDSDEGSNGGHGAITNCSINHSNSNNGYGLIIKGAGLELVNNCNFYFSDIRIEGTKGNIISNCGFGTNADIEITGGTCSIVEGCMFRTSDNKIKLYNNTAAKVINCFTRAGNEVEPITSDVPI